jgi:hypothetical protein
MNVLENPVITDDISRMQTIDKHFRKLTEPVFRKHGFAQGDLLAHWPQIVGEQAAAISSPEKIRWPHGKDAKAGGTLHLKVKAGRGLDVEYAADGIIERVNRFLGYQGVVALKVVQSHEFRPSIKISRKPVEPTAAILARVAAVADPDLQAALARLGAGVSAVTPRSPQAK